MNIEKALRELFNCLEEIYKACNKREEKKFNELFEKIKKILEFLEKESSKLSKPDRNILVEIIGDIVKDMKFYNVKNEVKGTLISNEKDIIESFNKIIKILKEIKKNIDFYLNNLDLIMPLIVAHIINDIYISLSFITESNRRHIKKKVEEVYKTLKETEEERLKKSRVENIREVIKTDLEPVEDAMKELR